MVSITSLIPLSKGVVWLEDGVVSTYSLTLPSQVPCQGLMESCSMKVRSGTCYCCDLYDCAK